jgi:dTDP-4-dehydrorhamnose 3,5-epimerase
MSTLRLEPGPIDGVAIVRPDKFVDERGFFARLYSRDEFAAAGFAFVPRQISTSFNARAGTLRGLHWQAAPQGETKLVRVTSGRSFHVAADLRENSPTRWRWFGITLDAREMLAILIQPGLAHGFITLVDDTEINYAMDVAYVTSAARGARWNDPALAIEWPRQPTMISDRDRSWPDLEQGRKL